MNKSVLVTGASGFIGSALSRRLARAGAVVHATSRTPLVEPGVRWRACDLADYGATWSLLKAAQPEIVLHLASHVTGARAPHAVGPTFRDNLASTVNVLLAAQELGCGRVILTGSLEEPDPGPDWSVPASPYAAAKLAASSYGRMFHALYGLPVTMLRVFMVYGPGQRDTTKLVPYVITSLLRDELPRLGSGTREVDWIYVDDVVNAFMCAATTCDLGGDTIDVGSGSLTTVRRVVETIFDLMRPGMSPRLGDVVDRPMEQTRVANVESTSGCMNWQPHVSLTDGLRRTIAWYREQHGLTPGL